MGGPSRLIQVHRKKKEGIHSRRRKEQVNRVFPHKPEFSPPEHFVSLPNDDPYVLLNAPRFIKPTISVHHDVMFICASDEKQ